MKKICPVHGCKSPALPWKWQHYGRCSDCDKKGVHLTDIYKRLIRLGHPAGEYRIPLKAFDYTHPGRVGCFGWGIRGVMLHPDIPYYQDLPLFGVNHE